MTTLASVFDTIANIASSTPWDESAILKCKNFKEEFFLSDLGSHVDNFLVKPTKTKTSEQKIEEMKQTPFKWISISMASYYGDLWFDLKKSDIPPMQSVTAAGSFMLITPADLVNILEVQKAKGYKFLVNLEVNPVVTKHTGTVNVQLRNFTVNK